MRVSASVCLVQSNKKTFCASLAPASLLGGPFPVLRFMRFLASFQCFVLKKSSLRNSDM